MKEHKKETNAGNGNKPLFLYVSFNAAHTPLQSEPEWLEKCSHIPHHWRKHYCGLMVGLDQAVDTLVKGSKKLFKFIKYIWNSYDFFSTGAKDHLGDDTVLVVTSDNGGANWFGGLNEPLRGAKKTFFKIIL